MGKHGCVFPPHPLLHSHITYIIHIFTITYTHRKTNNGNQKDKEKISILIKTDNENMAGLVLGTEH